MGRLQCISMELLLFSVTFFNLYTVVSVLLVSRVNLESADAQEIGITYEMMQVCECS